MSYTACRPVFAARQDKYLMILNAENFVTITISKPEKGEEIIHYNILHSLF